MKFKLSTVTKKVLMALTGLILVLFVLGHMAGNLQMFISQDVMNHYAYLLQHMPYGLLWVVRSVLLVAVLTHGLLALILTLENRRARPEGYRVKKTMQASLASKTMGVSGSIILIFIFFHIGHFTLRCIFPEYKTDAFYTTLNGMEVYDVYKMVITGFSKPLVSIFYIISMAFLCLHLSHGVSSMFQSIGWRNKKWKGCLDTFALIYGWVIFLGFISTPIAILMSLHMGIDSIPAREILGK